MSEAKEKKTTVRAKLTKSEHSAVKWVVKHKCNMTIDEFTKNAVVQAVERAYGKPLSYISDILDRSGKYIQEELF